MKPSNFIEQWKIKLNPYIIEDLDKRFLDKVDIKDKLDQLERDNGIEINIKKIREDLLNSSGER